MLRTMQRLQRREDGGAAVEFAVLMFILCPLWFFTMFSSDAMFHMLDVQEAVLSATWDLSQQQFGNEKDMPDVGQFNRLQFADHDSSFTNEDVLSTGFSKEDHHTNPFGHTCFCQGHDSSGNLDCRKELKPYTTKEAHQVACKWVKGVGFGTPPAQDLASAVGGQGGVWECGAKGWLYNYLVPERFIPDFKAAERVPLFTRKKRAAGQHDNDGALSADILLREHAAIVIDPWAVTVKPNGGVTPGVEREDTDPIFFKRTLSVFTHKIWYAFPTVPAMSFMGKAANKKLGVAPASPTGDPTVLGLDNILGLWMNVKYPAGKNGGSVNDYTDSDRFFTTPLLPNSKERQVFNDTGNRGYHYMGRKR